MIKANTSLGPIPTDAKVAFVSSTFVVNEVPMAVFDNPTTERYKPTEGKTNSKDQTRKSLQVIEMSCFKIKAMSLHIAEH